MKRKIVTIISKPLSVLALLAFTTSTGALAQGGEETFNKNCTACHTIGGGRLVGPDLQGVTNKRDKEWLAKFIKNSQDLIASGDADAQAIFDEFNGVPMPPQNLSDEELNVLIEYLISESPAEVAETEETPAAGEAEEEAEAPVAAGPTQEDIDNGALYFVGKLSFENGGPACTACHDLNSEQVDFGGNLALNLSDAPTLNLDHNGIAGWLGAPAPEAMKVAYFKGEEGATKELTEKERKALGAFLADSKTQEVYSREKTTEGWFMYGGIAGIIGLLGLYSMVWFNRKRKSAKHDILKRQYKTK